MARSDRFDAAIAEGVLRLPDVGEIAVCLPPSELDLSWAPKNRLRIIHHMKPEYDAWSARGFDCSVTQAGPYAAAMIFLPRSKQQARDLIARMSELTNGPIFVDGQKTDGVDGIIRDLRKAGARLSGVTAKAHGKLFAIYECDLAGWRSVDIDLGNGLATRPGVFSADAVDKGSELLADALPASMKGKVADLGAGWGYLSVQVLRRPDVTECHLFEADRLALDLAQANVDDARARFHWSDVTHVEPEYAGAFDHVVMNPPFHTSRAATPDLGRAFIATAAEYLGRHGTLWMVANRHLPYEAELKARFVTVTELAAPPAFKLFRAERPSVRAATDKSSGPRPCRFQSLARPRS